MSIATNCLTQSLDGQRIVWLWSSALLYVYLHRGLLEGPRLLEDMGLLKRLSS
jgi:hypothetical protein